MGNHPVHLIGYTENGLPFTLATSPS
jgi:hypothetical protein